MNPHPLAYPNDVCTDTCTEYKHNPVKWSDRVSAVHGRRAELEKKDETKRGNDDRISEVF